VSDATWIRHIRNRTATAAEIPPTTQIIGTARQLKKYIHLGCSRLLE
jgi:hypothetical protein